MERSLSQKRDSLPDSGNSKNLEEEADRLSQTSRQLDQFIHDLSVIHDKASSVVEAPDFLREFNQKVEARIHRYNSGDLKKVLGKNAEEDAIFMETVRQMARLTNALSQFKNVDSMLNQTSALLQGAFVFLAEEFRTLLEDYGIVEFCVLENRKIAQKPLSFGSNSNRYRSNSGKCCSDDYPEYPPEVTAKLGEIASTMSSVEREKRCCPVYICARRNAIRNYLVKQGLEMEVNTDEVIKMPWDSLEKVITQWINMVKSCSEVILREERKLVNLIFSDSPKICQSLLRDIVNIVVIQLLDFAEASVRAKQSAEKLFRFLDMYEALQNLIKSIAGNDDDNEVMPELITAADLISEAAARIFCDLENSIESDATRTPVPGGAVHPLTRYVTNYLQYSCEYKDSLESIFEKQTHVTKRTQFPIPSSNSFHDTSEKEPESPHGSRTPFSTQVLLVLDLLHSNLDEKSKLYKDPSLHYIFLMNNGRYILQKVNNSNEIQQVISETWYRKRSMIVQQYHKNYQRETWNRVLNCLSQEGLLVNGKVNKPLLKEKLKTFTSVMEEIHKTQSSWVVSDEELQFELRISISSVVIPAYRSFLGRFKKYLRPKQVTKYIKYQPEDVEALIEGLFEGRVSSTPKKKS